MNRHLRPQRGRPYLFHRPSRGRVRVAALLILAGLLVLAWLLGPGRLAAPPGTESAAVSPPVSGSAVEPAAESGGAGPDGAAGGESDPLVDDGRGERARAAIRELRGEGGPLDLDRVYAQAEQFQQAGLLTDAYLLYFLAARDGHTPSAMVLGAMYDPAYHSEVTSVSERPDPAQAYKWYWQASRGGDPVAREHLAHLKARVEDSARHGDRQAQRLLLEWR